MKRHFLWILVFKSIVMHVIKNIDLLSSVELSSSYSLVRYVKLRVAPAVSKRIKEEKIDLSTDMKMDVFATFDYDNLDPKKKSKPSNIILSDLY